jgi:hypothetical protein
MNRKEELLACFTPAELTSKFRSLLDLYFDAGIIPHVGCELRGGNSGLPYMFAEPAQYKRHGHRFVTLGQATHSGTEYLLLRPEASRPVDEWPVVVSGDEGGVLALAQNLDDWLRFMTLNVQPYLGIDYENPPRYGQESVFNLFEEDEEEMATHDNPAYRDWLLQTWGLAPVTSIEQAHTEIIAPAYERYQQELDRLVYGDSQQA